MSSPGAGTLSPPQASLQMSPQPQLAASLQPRDLRPNALQKGLSCRPLATPGHTLAHRPFYR
jgi:hypothetical protein